MELKAKISEAKEMLNQLKNEMANNRDEETLIREIREKQASIAALKAETVPHTKRTNFRQDFFHNYFRETSPRSNSNSTRDDDSD